MYKMGRQIKYTNEVVGQTFGRLIITEYLGVINKNVRVMAKCECGVEKQYLFSNIKKGDTNSCGCLFKEVSTKVKTKHGLGNHPLARVWVGMLRRCYVKKQEGYEDYGGKGVEVCKEWREDFMNFYNWATINGYKKGLHLDKDKRAPTQTGKLYCPEYCCFLTSKENAKYRSDSIMIEYNNELKGVMEWSEILGVDAGLIRNRHKRGWLPERIFNTPCLGKFRNSKILSKS